jgi:hypothetical protein
LPVPAPPPDPASPPLPAAPPGPDGSSGSMGGCPPQAAIVHAMKPQRIDVDRMLSPLVAKKGLIQLFSILCAQKRPAATRHFI